jgi:hypothetical protein
MRLIYVLTLFALCTAVVFGQSFSSLTARITDPTSAAIGGAAVEVTNLDTSAKRSAISDETGTVIMNQMPPGRYSITVVKPGFTETTQNVTLVVNTPLKTTIEMKVGELAQTVEVTAEATLVNAQDASLGTAITKDAIAALPLAARNPATLLSLQPGVTFFGTIEGNYGVNTTSTTITTYDRLNGSVNGSKPDQNNITLDGIDVNDQNTRNPFQSVLRTTLDSVQEFRTTTQNPTAEQGRGSGAQIALVTKSGTNTFHGSLYEYNRVKALAANDFFKNQLGQPKDGLIRNVFGASVGGPVKKDRLFFFANYEGRRDVDQLGAPVRLVPTDTLRQGVIRYFNSSGGISTMSPAQLQQIDPAGKGVNPAVLSVLNAYPASNDNSIGDGLNTAGYRFSFPYLLRWNTYALRIDYSLDNSAKNTVFWRGNLQNDNVSRRQQFPSEAGPRGLDNSKGFAASWTSVLSPTLVNTVRYGFTRNGHQETGTLSSPYVTFRGLASLHDTSTGLARIIPVHQIGDDASWTKGKHDFRFGGAFRHINNLATDYTNSFPTGSVTYSYLAGTGGSLRPSDLASSFSTAFRTAAVDLLGPVDYISATFNYKLDGTVLGVGDPVHRNYLQNEYELYLNDNWRLRQNLSVNLGVRYTLTPSIKEANGYQVSPTINLHDWWLNREALGNQGRSQADAGVVSYVLASSAQGGPLYPTQKKNFSPRVALAYSPNAGNGLGKFIFGENKTSIRAGFGMFYDVFGMGLIRQYDSTAPGLATNFQTPANANLATAARFTAYTSLPPGALPAAPKFGFPFTPPLAGFTITNSIDPAIKQPYTINLNLSVAREVQGGLMVQVSYVGRLSRRTLAVQDLAQPTINLRDPKSGNTYSDAANQLSAFGRKNVPVSQIPTNPFWEDMFPTYADPKNGLTATQGMYLAEFFKNSNQTDMTSAILDIDNDCSVSDGTCSILGQNAIFNGQFADLYALSSVGKGNYHSMQWTVTKRFGSGSSLTFNYAFSKSTDLTSATEGNFANGSYGVILNSYQRSLNKSVSDFDIRHQVNGYAVVELPFGRGRKLFSSPSSVVNGIIGGWNFSTLYQVTSGIPRSVSESGNWPTNWGFSGFGSLTGVQPASGVTKNVAAPNGTLGPNVFLDPQAARDAYDYTFGGQAGQRNGIRGDGFLALDMTLAKRFVMPYKENHALQFRWEVYNVPNTPRFDINTASVDIGAVGTFGKYSTMLNNPRVMQLSLRYEF